MKNTHAHACILLLVTLLAAGCSASSKPEHFREVAKDKVADRDLREAAMQSERVITVTVDAGRNVFFRKEKVGTLENFGPLKERVRQAVEKNREADPKHELAGGNIVYFCAPSDFTYGDVAGVMDAIKDAGGSPAGITDCDLTGVKPSP